MPILFYLAVTILIKSDIPSICLFKLLTGHECWGCGMTRAFDALFHLDFAKAYELNPRIIIVAPLMIYIWFETFYKCCTELKKEPESAGLE